MHWVLQLLACSVNSGNNNDQQISHAMFYYWKKCCFGFVAMAVVTSTKLSYVEPG